MAEVTRANSKLKYQTGDVPVQADYEDLHDSVMWGNSVSVISSTTTAGSEANMNYVYLCSSTFTLTMPTAVGNKNQYTIKNTGTGTITIATTSSQTIDGGSTATMSIQYDSINLVSDGTNWNII